MTTPVERYYAIEYARGFLYDSLHNQKLSLEVREQVYAILKHYPGSETMKIVCQLAPEVFHSSYDRSSNE